MGFDVSKCSNVILFGLPENIVDVMQEIGRIGRDGEAYHLRKLDKAVKDILCSDTCRRIAIMNHFLNGSDLNELKIGKWKTYVLCCVWQKL